MDVNKNSKFQKRLKEVKEGKQLKTKTMYINVNFEVTEYNIKPAKNYEKVKFTIWEDSLIIEFCDFGENVLNQSEISIEDAKKLSKLLLTI